MNNDYAEVLSDADALIIIPPFDDLRWPSLGAHLLQACAREKGFNVRVFYANMALAAVLGEELFTKIGEKRYLREVLFANMTYGVESFYKDDSVLQQLAPDMKLKDLIKIEKKIEKWVDGVVEEILKHHFRIIGCSTTFGHVTASICLLNKIKIMNPAITTIIGGAYCFGELTEGVASLTDKIDYIFSGESEITFPNFIKQVLINQLPKERIIAGERPDINRNPVPDYSDYFMQSQKYLPESKREIMITYETSRGCWWGQKKPCNFCGLNCDLAYHYKSPPKVINDLKKLSRKFPGYRILMADCIMPFKYFTKLLRDLPRELPGVEFFYEVKANLKLEQVALLKNAGITRVQPGIETLSSPLLKKINKGCLARHNIAVLRYFRSAGIIPHWNFLFRIPGETPEDYRSMIELIPLIKHLQPPLFISPIALFRHSKYFIQPESFGITNLSPMKVFYNALLPKWADINKYAYDFEGEFRHFENDPIVQEVLFKVEEWMKVWREKQVPKLKLVRIPEGKYLLIDSRGLKNPLTSYLSEKQAMVTLLDWPMSTVNYLVEDEIQWAIEQQLMVTLDSWYISLVTAELDLLLEFKEKAKEVLFQHEYAFKWNATYQHA